MNDNLFKFSTYQNRKTINTNFDCPKTGKGILTMGEKFKVIIERRRNSMSGILKSALNCFACRQLVTIDPRRTERGTNRRTEKCRDVG